MKLSCTPSMKLENDSYDWYARHEEKCREAAKRNHDIVMVGDSITHFWENHAESWAAFTKGRDVFNLGFGWDRTCNVLCRLQYGEFEGQTPRILILNIGTNNISSTDHYPGDTPKDAADGIAAVVDVVRAKSPATKLIVMCPFQRGTNAEPFRAWLRTLAQCLHAKFDGAGDDNIVLVDISEKFLRPDGEIDSSLFCGDNCHPNEKGYAIWREALEPYLA